MKNKNIVTAIGVVNQSLSDRVCVGTKELTLSDAAQSLSFASLLDGCKAGDIKSVCIKVKKAGSPTDATHLVRYTLVNGDTPTTSHGMWMGDGDYFEITNNTNIQNLKVISAEAGIASILTIEYYG